MAARVVVPPLTQDELREVIEMPASARVLFFEPHALVDRLINDVVHTPGALPLLSFTLRELYVKYVQEGRDNRSLSLEDYEALGSVGGALRNRATEVYERLPDDAHRAAMRRVMLRMVSIEGGELARRRVPDAELVYGDPAENRRVNVVVGLLTEARLIVAGKEADEQAFIEPAHDELIRGWDRLLSWVQGEREQLALRRLLTPAADWKNGRGGLWSANPRLSLLKPQLRSGTVSLVSEGRSKGECWLNAVETEFVKKSIRRRTITYSSIIISAFTLLIMLGLMSFLAQDRNSQREQASLKAREKMKQEALNYESQGLQAQLEAGYKLWQGIEPSAAPEDLSPRAKYALHMYAQAATQAAKVGASEIELRNRHRLGLLSRRPKVLSGHTGPIVHLAVDSRRRILASSSTDKTVRLWDLTTGRLIHVLDHSAIRKHIGFCVYSCFSPDGTRIVTCNSSNIGGNLVKGIENVPHDGTDQYAYIWDVSKGEIIASLKGLHFPRS
jgi:hypothetical protein